MFEKFQQRSRELERLDTGDYTRTEYRRWQQEMRVIHRLFGEMRALKNTLFRDLESSGTTSISILDVGAGSGELLRQLAKWITNRDAFFVGAEINADAAWSINSPTIAAVRCDALELPFPANSFDYVFCSLFLHHLDDEPATHLLKEMKRVAKRRIYVIDLNRHPLAYYFYNIVGRLFLQRFTLEDGSLSILRSRVPEELIVLAESAGLSDIKVYHSRANRLVLSGI